ncbi:G-protein coupled receptor Mth2-like [Temnothorax curvispinosus]|uniref:G-protein coupled receptor Mth2-like n=1 Tax=Temnothorax curvispinosus TaxID=300111 RepID=A0A6J1Q9A2_9HYME|nr:G-protein coupled receptor Mth2-like [Temnothorax curvispinosus]XP_024878875.1 G-protein coupled receptor Mth2-like [Temnothorax curvispinosus]XP_024878876.1 G-protein coupled receptor Mth2-like [Temnothorax curvispinosus]XP_024878877.1 G-protein coupled receptor Mth2-like [Temnothorax curvispinosus]XP_024878878.1 G-protein coupled receptor Mth2-like [Temnothorax curvispinosus]XP_024878879.1 G-protein coupled receptor Mth2-like [Temnothorax curvispinosus]XP_024878880.1 G-protein coupled re
MCPPSTVLWCYVLLLVASSSKSLESLKNSINNDEQRGNPTVRHDLFENSMKDRDDEVYNLRENSTKNDDKTRHEPYINSNEACDHETCIQLCCPFGDRLTSGKKCVAGQNNYSFPDVYNQNNSVSKKLDELFQLTVNHPCVLQGSAHRILDPDEYSFLVNGSLYYRDSGELVPSTSYCLGAFDRNTYDAVICLDQIGFPTYIPIYLLLTLPFLVLTFVIYSILPELRNLHSYTLRVQVASLFTTNVVIYFIQEIPELSEWPYCIPLAYIFHFSMLAACFWLNAMCIDIWWTFRKLDLQSAHGKKKKRKIMIYSIYGWGVTFILTAVCAIMDHTSGIPKSWIRPEMCKRKFWFGPIDAFSVYYYGPTGIAFASNYCFFIATALAILYHNKHTAHQLRDSESRSYDKKKRKFSMYLKLFIVMGVSWSLDVILWFVNTSIPIPTTIWYISYMIDISRAFVIFIVYVCKKKVLQLLLKRFGWQGRGPFGNVSLYTHSTTSSNMSHRNSSTSGTSMKDIDPSVSQQTDPNVESNARL